MHGAHSGGQRINGILRCYNMFPTQFPSIDEMTSYLDTVHDMGFNAVWINPIQMAGDVAQSKSDINTGVRAKLSHSMYAMTDMQVFDPRFSVIKPNEEGNYVFTAEQRDEITSLSRSEKEALGIPTASEELNRLFSLTVVPFVEGYKSKLLFEERKIEEIKTKLSDRSLLKEERKALNAEKEAKEEYVKTGGAKELKECIKTIHREQEKIIQHFNNKAICKFTTKAKTLGLTPMFDLVLNHVAKDSPLVSEHPDLFLPETKDVSFPDVREFDYKNSGVCTQALEEVWKPFINKYIKEYGFEGVRVDCVRKVPGELRKQVYGYIHELNATSEKARENFILEEALFSSEPVESYVGRNTHVGATHITTGSFYTEREWHGGMPRFLAREDGLKSSIVSCGAINFTGNHDHETAAMKALSKMALARINSADPALYKSMEPILKSEPDRKKFLYSTIKDLQKEMKDDPTGQTNRLFIRTFRDILSINMLVGSAGYYMLSGDEVANTINPSVFLLEGRKEVLPRKELSIFTHRGAGSVAGAGAGSVAGAGAGAGAGSEEEKLANIVAEVLKDHALKLLGSSSIKRIYNSLSPDPIKQDKFLQPYIDQVQNEINAGVTTTCDSFVESMKKAGVPGFQLKRGEYTEVPHSRDALGSSQHNLTDFIKDINNIIVALPPIEKGCWTESFMLDEDTSVIVRKNGLGYGSPTDIIFCNLSSEKVKEIGTKDIKKIATWMQNRGFPPINDRDYEETYRHEPEFRNAYECIWGIAGIKTTLHATSGIKIADEVMVDQGIIASGPKVIGVFAGRETSTLPDDVSPGSEFAVLGVYSEIKGLLASPPSLAAPAAPPSPAAPATAPSPGAREASRFDAASIAAVAKPGIELVLSLEKERAIDSSVGAGSGSVRSPGRV